MTLVIILFATAVICAVIAIALYLRLTWDMPLPDYTDEEWEEQLRRRNDETAVLAAIVATF